jgi:hypothetical protein
MQRFTTGNAGRKSPLRRLAVEKRSVNQARIVPAPTDRYRAALKSRKRMNVHGGENGMQRRFPRMTVGRVAIPALLAIATTGPGMAH